MKNILFIAAILLFSGSAHAEQCPTSREDDLCRMVWSAKYGSCIIADETACTKDDLLDIGSDVWRQKITEFQVALETSNIAAMPAPTRKWARLK